jgi:CubicO group peptidase (beta-lactamase class C family)
MIATQYLEWARRPALAGLLGMALVFTGGCAGSSAGGARLPSLPLEMSDAKLETQSPPSSGSILRADYRPVRERMGELIERVRAKYRIAGLSIALVDGGELVWAEGFGLADREARVPAGADTVYRVGSIAKPLTATAVMQLEERWVLDIDTPVEVYLPEFSIRSRFSIRVDPITPRSVLTHHSGLPTDFNKGMWSNRPFTELTAKLQREFAAYPPNFVFSYSNVGYSALGHLVQRVGGEEFTQYMDRAVFRPAGMLHSGYRVSPRMRPRLSKGYRDGKPMRLLPIRDLPAFGLYSSATDLARFAGVLMNRGRGPHGRILQPGTVEEMFEVQNDDVPLDLRIRTGLGWFLEQDTVPGGGLAVRHGGTTLSFAGEVILLPEQGLAAVVLANTHGTRQVVSHLAEDALAMALSLTRRVPEGHSVARADWPDEPVGEMVEVDAGGSYATGMGLVAIRPEARKICACMVEKDFDIIPYPDGWFGIRPDAVDSLPPRMRGMGRLRFATRKIGGREVIIAERNGSKVLLGEKMKARPVPPAWQRRVGKYSLLNPDPDFPLEDPEVWYRHGTLGMSYRLPLLSESTISVSLQPISDTEAIIMGLGRMRGETLLVIEELDGSERLRYSGFEGKKL